MKVSKNLIYIVFRFLYRISRYVCSTIRCIRKRKHDELVAQEMEDDADDK